MRRPLTWALAIVISTGAFGGCSSEELPSAPSASSAPAAPKDAAPAGKAPAKTARSASVAP